MYRLELNMWAGIKWVHGNKCMELNVQAGIKCKGLELNVWAGIKCLGWI
jgi:hypothetical protein